MKRLDERHFSRTLDVLTRAFEDDELYQYLEPDTAERHRFVRDFLTFRTRYLFKRCQVFADGDEIHSVMAAAPAGQAMSKLDFVLCGGLGPLLRATPTVRRRMLDFVSYLDRCEEECCPRPHQMLGPLATHPDHQGKGLGGALFSHMVNEVCDPNVALCLDTRTPRNVQLYEKYGFYVVKEEFVPGSRVTNFVMLRDPGGKM